MLLYHAGFEIIREPDLRRGRRNADFGQGFYLSPEREFACRWARERAGETTVVNEYVLETEGLQIRCLRRDREWFDYIYGNRNRQPDRITADAVIGPIANDTIYDTLGITTSGFLTPEQALQLLLIGPEYRQVVIKTAKAAGQLQWLSAQTLSHEQVAEFRKTVAEEEEVYQQIFFNEMERMGLGG